MSLPISGGSQLSIFEAESLIRSLRQFPLSEIGSPAWFTQHETLERLNIDCHYQAQYASHDEFIVQLFIQHDQTIITLIHELLAIEMWKERVFPSLLPSLLPFHSVKSYLLLYHEATLINLLEILCFHSSFVEAMGDSVIELAQYCYRKFVHINSGKFRDILLELDETVDKTKEIKSSKSGENGNGSGSGSASGKGNGDDNESIVASLERQSLVMEYSISMCSISVLRYLTDCLASLPLGFTTLLLNNQDILMQLIPMIELAPWTRWRKTKTQRDPQTRKVLKPGIVEQEKFLDQQWRKVKEEEWNALSKIEGQVWITMINLLLHPQCRQLYLWHSYRRDMILRLKPMFQSILLDQLPPLKGLQRFVEELAIMPPPESESTNRAPVVEYVPKLRNSIVDGVQFDSLQRSAINIFPANQESAVQDAKRLASIFSLDELDAVLNETPICCVCGAEAVNRCSKCHLEWYCSRECQVKQWPKHKELCGVVSQQKKEKDEQRKQEKEEWERKRREEAEKKEREEQQMWEQKRRTDGPLKGSAKIEVIDD